MTWPLPKVLMAPAFRHRRASMEHSKEVGRERVDTMEALLSPVMHTSKGKGDQECLTSDARDVPLRHVSDEVLLAEFRFRNLKLYDTVTAAVVEQRYTFGEVLGRGGSACVYAAKSKRSRRNVAIKVIEKNDHINDKDLTTPCDIST